MWRIFKLMFCICAISFLNSCKDDYEPEESFVKIYDDAMGNKSFFPLSIKRTNDNGYLILSARDGWNISLLKTDKIGELEWTYDLPNKYVNAVTSIVEQNGNFYFFCMDAVGLFTYVMQVDEAGKSAQEVHSFPYILYPTFAYNSGNAVYVQSYKRLSYETGIYKLNSSLNDTVVSGSVKIMENIETRIVDHISYNGKRMPFFITATPENDFIVMSGFYNYSFSLVFLNANLKFSGVYNGANYNGGLNATLPLGGNQFAIARFAFGNLYYNAKTSLNPADIEIAENIPAQGFSELDAQKPVIIKEIAIEGKNHLAFIATTKSNQLLISFFDENDGTIKGKKYIGQNTPYTICDAEVTSDNGMMLLIQAKIMGSFNRIATVKLTEQQIIESLEKTAD